MTISLTLIFVNLKLDKTYDIFPGLKATKSNEKQESITHFPSLIDGEFLSANTTGVLNQDLTS